jgi:hypothetical protein
MEFMIAYKEVCNEKIERAAMHILLADVVVTAFEAAFVSSVLILEVVVLHAVIAGGALLTVARCLVGPFAHRRIEHFNDMCIYFTHAMQQSVEEKWSRGSSDTETTDIIQTTSTSDAALFGSEVHRTRRANG